MKPSHSQLTPFVRSDAVGAILAELLGHPDRELSLSELGRRTGVSAPVVHREVSRLVDTDVLLDRYEGRNRLVRANEEHALFTLMRDLISATYGPVPVLRELFDKVEGIDQALIYGSWAARRAGLSGPYPNDIDVLVIGSTPRKLLATIAARAEERLSLPVNVTRLGPDDWSADTPSPFVATLRERPFVDIATGEVHE